MKVIHNVFDFCSFLRMEATDGQDGLQSGKAAAEPRWQELEMHVGAFKDERLGKRCQTVLSQLSEATAESIPWACPDWANTKAAYRFFDNERVCEQEILAGRCRATQERFAQERGTMLVLHDTTQLAGW